MSKTIQINPDLFRLSSKPGRKRGNSTEKTQERIKVKNTSIKEKAKSAKSIRKDLLKFIRKQQEKNFKHLIQNDENIVDKHDGEEEFSSDFDKSLEYLMKIVEENKPEDSTPLNRTFKNRTTDVFPKDSIPAFPDLVDIGLPDDLYSTESKPFKDQTIMYHYGETHPPPIQPNTFQLPAPPKYGCLKNGTLPTYRTYKNWTQKIRNGQYVPPPPPPPSREQPRPQYIPPSPSTYNYPPRPPPTLTQYMDSEEPAKSLNEPVHPFVSQLLNQSLEERQNTMVKDVLQNAKERTKEKTKRMVAEIKQGAEKQKLAQKRSALRYLKQRKTVRRTYAVGKSRFQPKIGVLISNKTIRSHITTQAQKLKQIPINEVRTYLVKKGFIKVGTSAPNDVLRKMYESVFLICGEVENHNSENLLYNYFNDIPK
jgi:hypothetical protein